MKRARDLGVPFHGVTGPKNAIVDIAGVKVGHTTIIAVIRTGVTAILPRGPAAEPVMAGWHSLNGNGEMTGTTWLDESGLLSGPVMLTNTNSVGVVRDAVIAWQLKQHPEDDTALPVVAETWDGWMNDINGFHVTKEHAFAALDSATADHVPEGNVGGGTGMRCYEFKGGIGTSSRIVPIGDSRYTVGVLVQANYGKRAFLTVAGVPVGKHIPDLMQEEGKISRPKARVSVRLPLTEADLNAGRVDYRYCRNGCAVAAPSITQACSARFSGPWQTWRDKCK